MLLWQNFDLQLLRFLYKKKNMKIYHLLLFFLPLLKGQEHPDFHDYMKGLFNNDNKWTNFLVELNRQTVVCPNISPFIFRSYIFRFRDKFDELALRINYGNQTKARCLKITKKSRSTRAKRATFTLWVDKSSWKMPKIVNLRVFGNLKFEFPAKFDFLQNWWKMPKLEN